jgi:hypothetical protein
MPQNGGSFGGNGVGLGSRKGTWQLPQHCPHVLRQSLRVASDLVHLSANVLHVVSPLRSMHVAGESVGSTGAIDGPDGPGTTGGIPGPGIRLALMMAHARFAPNTSSITSDFPTIDSSARLESLYVAEYVPPFSVPNFPDRSPTAHRVGALLSQATEVGVVQTLQLIGHCVRAGDEATSQSPRAAKALHVAGSVSAHEATGSPVIALAPVGLKTPCTKRVLHASATGAP